MRRCSSGGKPSLCWILRLTFSIEPGDSTSRVTVLQISVFIKSCMLPPCEEALGEGSTPSECCSRWRCDRPRVAYLKPTRTETEKLTWKLKRNYLTSPHFRTKPPIFSLAASFAVKSVSWRHTSFLNVLMVSSSYLTHFGCVFTTKCCRVFENFHL